MNEILRRDQAMKYAPKTKKEIERAARDLHASGFSEHTVSSILRLNVAEVRQILGDRSLL